MSGVTPVLSYSQLPYRPPSSEDADTEDIELDAHLHAVWAYTITAHAHKSLSDIRDAAISCTLYSPLPLASRINVYCVESTPT